MRNNLRLAIPLSFASMLFFPSVTWMFYFAQYLNYQQIAGIMGIGAIVTLVAEIPTGVFADMVGRKWAIFLSYLLFTLAMVGTTFATTYWAFLLVTIMNALVNSLYSGSMEALVYDSLKSAKAEQEFDVWISRMASVTWIGLFISSISGGYMYSLNPNFPYYAQATMVGLSTIMSLFLVEPKLDSVKYQLADLWRNNIAGFKELFGNQKLQRLAGIFVAIGLGYYVAADILGLSQLREYGLNTKIAGWIFGIGFIVSATMSHFYPQMRKRVGEMRLMWISASAMVASLLVAKYVGVGIGLGLIMMRISSSTTFSNSKSVMINREIASRNRATSLSTLNLLTILPYGLSATLIGRYIDANSPNKFAFVLGLFILTMVMGSQILHSRKKFAKLRG